MSEDVKPDVEEVVQPTETEAVVKESEQPKEPEKGSTEYNFREARKIMSEQNRRIHELEEHLRSSAANSAQPKDELEGVSDDEFLTRKQAEAIALRKAQELLQEQEYSTLEDRMRLKFKDYDDIVTEEHVKELIEDDRDLADSIKSSPNPYATAYKLIKKSAFYQDKGKKPNKDAEKLVKNAQKPVSSNAVQSRPLSNANAFAFSSKEEKDALYREMMQAASRR